MEGVERQHSNTAAQQNGNTARRREGGPCMSEGIAYNHPGGKRAKRRSGKTAKW